MDAVPLDHLPSDLREALSRRAESEGKTTSEYVLELIRRDLNVTPWSTWLEQLSQDEPVTDADIAAALAEARQEHDAALFLAVTKEEQS